MRLWERCSSQVQCRLQPKLAKFRLLIAWGRQNKEVVLVTAPYIIGTSVIKSNGIISFNRRPTLWDAIAFLVNLTGQILVQGSDMNHPIKAIPWECCIPRNFLNQLSAVGECMMYLFIGHWNVTFASINDNHLCRYLLRYYSDSLR